MRLDVAVGVPDELPIDTVVHRVGGGAIENLRLSELESASSQRRDARNHRMLTVGQNANPTIELVDRDGTCLGQVRIESQEGTSLQGEFLPTSEFAKVAPLFHEFEDAVTSQALSILDRLDAKIAELGLHLRIAEASYPAHDVQIYRDGGVSLRAPVNAGRLHFPARATSARP